MELMRFAGDNPIMQKMMEDMSRNEQDYERRKVEAQALADQQIRRDMAAAEGRVIPFH